MVAYTFFGGLWALVVTDYVQFLMKALAMLLMLPLPLLWLAECAEHSLICLPDFYGQ